MPSSPEPLVQTLNNFTEIFLMMPSTKIAQMVYFCQKGICRALDKKYPRMKSPAQLVQNLNNFTEMVLMLPSTVIDQKVQLGWTTRLPELEIEISFKSYHILLATGQYIIYSCASTPGPSCLNKILYTQFVRVGIKSCLTAGFYSILLHMCEF